MTNPQVSQGNTASGIQFPESSSTVAVQIINTTMNIVCPTDYFLEPAIPGQEHLNLPTFAFLIENKSLRQHVLFDLGCRKDWWNLAPAVQASIRAGTKALEVGHGITDILKNGGFDPNRVDAIILSHSHLDHIGDPSLFPKTTQLVVGPGFKSTYMPGFPTYADSTTLDSDFDGRVVNEIDFHNAPKIGGFRSFDYFGDGSLYILDVPGHTVGHISVLARTTKDTFVFLGGDVLHYAGGMRPTPSLPLPEIITPDLLHSTRVSLPCSCSIFTACHPNQAAARTSPYYRITRKADSWYVDGLLAQQSVDHLKGFDADEKVLVALAHDVGLQPVVTFFPDGYLNGWREKGWKRKSAWGFLDELPLEGKAKADLVPGLMRDGRIVE